MSEQLTWEGLLPSKPSQTKETGPEPTAGKKIPVQSPKKQPQADADIQNRINRLIEAKDRAEAVLAAKQSTSQKIPMVQVTETLVIESEFIEEEKVEPPQPEILTVTHLNKQIKNLLEKNFPFLWVKGEISNLKIPGSGHLYFTLKDAGAQIRAVMFRGFAQGLKFKVEDGMEVLVRCRVTAYEPRGDYQLFCEVMEPVGFGALQVAFDQLKAKLQSEGLFDESRKRPIPQYPTRIGIITSPTGAAIRDMINILARRSGGGVDITILPTSVQGDKAPGEIVTALTLANKLGLERFDVLIVGRGGGSIEDLWAFNTEEVVRAVSKSKIPVISAVGHEVDFTICDFVADLRAPTPSAAAELVVKNKKDLLERIKLLERNVLSCVYKKLSVTRTHLDQVSKRLIDPKRRLQDLMLRCDEVTERLINGIRRYIESSFTEIRFLRERLGTPQRKLELCQQKFLSVDGRLRKVMVHFVEAKKGEFTRRALQLNGLSPLAILDRGYSIIKKGDEIIKESSQVAPGDKIEIKLHKGELSAEIL